ncbi:MAG: hypothetical protein Q9182_005205 [Xanthomendoza sp. 2 TL-2023]
MKAFGLSHLVLLLVTLISCLTASPVPESPVSASAKAPQPQGPLANTATILTLATELFGIQLIGAQTNQASLERLCGNFNLTRLQASGYNTTILHQMFCQAASHTVSLDTFFREIAVLTFQYSTYIWIFQAVGAVKSDPDRLKQLCNLIDIPGSFREGQNGTLVKNTICNAAKSRALPQVQVPFFIYDGTAPGVPAELNQLPATGPKGPPPQDILNLASDLFAIQVVGSESSYEDLKSISSNGFDVTFLGYEGYNTTSIKTIFRLAAERTAYAGYGGNVPPLAEIQALTVEYSTWIWIYQAVGVVKNSHRRLQKLCELIDVAGSFNVGQNGTLVKTTICNAAKGVALPEVPLPKFNLAGLNVTAVPHA